MTNANIHARRQHITDLLAESKESGLDARAIAKEWGCSNSAIQNDIRCILASWQGCTIYGLRDPETGLIRYVGQCNGDPDNRYRKHIAMTQYGRERNSAKAEWIKALSAKDKKPELVILEKCPASQLNERERYWIKHFSSMGVELVNVIGKRGGRPRKQTT